MSRKRIYGVIILAVLALMGIVVLQIYWVKRAYSLEEKQFNDRVTVAMSSVVKQILKINKDSSFVEPVEQISPNYFVANINDTLYPYLLESLLREQFIKSNLTEDFEYGIYDCFNDSIIFGSRLSFADSISPNNDPELDISFQNKFDQDGHYFGIFFPQKRTVMLKNMDFWVFTSFLILMVVMFFGYTISIMLRQKRLSEVKTDFINNMTHELKTPISTIALSAEVLMDEKISKNPERLLNYATIIKNENERLKTQVEKVLELATFSTDKLKVDEKILNIHEIISKAIESFRINSIENNGSFELKLDAENYLVKGDEVHLTNLFYNLLDNACKYNSGSPKITVVTQNKNKKLCIAITDSGIGIDKKEHQLIFDKFYRVSTGNVHDVKGFGLGLYYVKTVVEAHGGTISLDSELGERTTFTVALKIS